MITFIYHLYNKKYWLKKSKAYYINYNLNTKYKNMSWLVCSLDIWNWYIKWVLLFEDYDSKKSIIAKDMIKSEWLKRWKILDSNNLIKSISKVIDNLSKKVDSQIDQVIVWISHPDMKIKLYSTHKRLVNIEITEKDVSSLLEWIQEFIDEPNMEVLKIIPIRWIIDDEHSTKNPVWMQWRKLDLQAYAFMIPTNSYKDLEKIFEELDIDVIDFIPNILWTEEACLTAETKDLWCVLIDIGANQTSYVIYEEWINIWYNIIPIWWEEITKDISIWLKIDYIQAEQIKKEEWSIILNGWDINWDINWNENSQIDKLFLSEIIEARLSEDIYKPIIEKMQELWVYGKLPWWIILIWWVWKIENIEEYTRNFFSLSCKLWQVNDNSFKELWSNPLFINTIWNYIWEEKYWESSWSFKLVFNMWFLKKIKDFVKKIF